MFRKGELHMDYEKIIAYLAMAMIVAPFLISVILLGLEIAIVLKLHNLIDVLRGLEILVLPLPKA